MIEVTLYTRAGCHLCENVKADLNALQTEYPHRLIEIDIETDPALHKKYLTEIPVISVGPYTAKAPLDRQKIKMFLGAATDRKNQLQKLNKPDPLAPARKSRGAADSVSYWIARHYLLLLNLFMFVYVGLPFLAPVLMKAGLETPARAIYMIYKPLCHQFGFRSFYLYGAQPFYPLKEANVAGVQTFEQVTGIQNLDDPFSLTRFQARDFIGNETVGYKIALCERDVAIYVALLFFGLVFGASGKKMKTLHWALWLLIGIAPIGLDGFSQLFSQFNWDWLSALVPYRESTPYLRALTGALFGFMTGWFAYPNIEESMRDTRRYYEKNSTR